MYPDGICKVNDRLYSKTMQFEDINYQLAQPDDKTAIFEGLCDFYNSVDSSVGLQLTFLNKTVNREEYESSISIPMQQDGFDDVRAEYSAMLKKLVLCQEKVQIKYAFFRAELPCQSFSFFI